MSPSSQFNPPATTGNDSLPDGSPGSPALNPGPTKPTYSKRGKITIVACVNCRRRKTKCDGTRPICGQCRARDGQCHYDMNEEQRRLTFLRENVEHLHEEKNSLESLIWNLRISTEEEAIEILRRLRKGTDPQTLAQNIQAGRTLAQVSRPGPEDPLSAPSGVPARPAPSDQLVGIMGKASPAELEEIVRRLRLQEDAESIMAAIEGGSLLQSLGPAGAYSSQEQRFGLTRAGVHTPLASIEKDQIQAQPARSSPPTIQKSSNTWWTTVTEDREVISHSLALYFSWQHCFFQSFPQKLFLQEMAGERTEYCSKLLVNAICSAGCLLSPWPNPLAATQSPSKLSKAFFEEAIRELASTEAPSMPAVAGLFIISHVEGVRGRMHRAWDYCGRSVRMALDLNLHLKDDRNLFTEDERIARNHVFWGCFIADQLVSFTLGRIPQIPTTAITVELPAISKEDDESPWEPFGDGDKIKTPGGRSTSFYETAALSKILNSTLLLFFAPSQNIKGSLLLDEYNKYKSWHKRLPPIVSLTEDSAPHVLSLHMYYHAAVLLLFRPFLKAKITNSSVSPSDICRTSAAAISDIFDRHRRLYGSVGIYTLQIHCLLTACTIHIINVPAIASSNYLISACNHFHQLALWNGWASGSLNIIRDLVQKWNIVLSMEAEQALYQENPYVHTKVLENDSGAMQVDGVRPSKRNAFLTPTSPILNTSKKQKLAMPRVLVHSNSSMSDEHPSTMGRRGSTTSTASSGRQQYSGFSDLTRSPDSAGPQQTNFLFTPFPNQPAPLMGPIHTSTMSDADVEPQTIQEFDGLSFEAESGWFDPFMGYEAFSSYGDGEIPRA